MRGYNIRFRHSTPGAAVGGVLAKNEFEFGEGQVWMRTGRGRLTWLDETRELMVSFCFLGG